MLSALLTAALAALSPSSAALLAQEEALGFEPARFLRGDVPGLPPLASTGGRTVIEVDVAASGLVTDSRVVDLAEPYSSAIREQTTLWRFRPASLDGRPVATKVLVVGVYRPPNLTETAVPTPESIRPPSEEVPYPTATATPSFPPQALYQGVALIGAHVGADGAILDATVLSAPQNFDEQALEAARRFRFRPARRAGASVESRVLFLFGFTQPIAIPRTVR